MSEVSIASLSSGVNTPVEVVAQAATVAGAARRGPATAAGALPPPSDYISPSLGLNGGKRALGTIANPTDILVDFQWRRSKLVQGQEKARRLFRLQHLANLQVDPDSRPHRVIDCLRKRHSDIEVVYSEQYDHPRASYKGLVTCGSWSACAVCGSKIGEARRAELSRVIKMARERGNVVVLATFTIPHGAGDDLAALVDLLNGTFSDIKTEYAYKRLVKQYGFVGPGRNGKEAPRLYQVRAFENTWGYNGHHPHLHVVFILSPGADVGEFQRDLREIWYRALGGQYLADPDTGELLPADPDHWDHGCTATSNDGKVADYVTKFGRDPRWDVAHEVAKANSKQGRNGKSKHYTMTDLLMSDDKRHGAIWLEYANVMRGRYQLTWSPGLRAWAGLGDERTDDDIAADGSDYKESLAGVEQDLWWRIRRNGRWLDVLAVAEGCAGDAVLVREYLDKQRVQFGLPVASWAVCSALDGSPARDIALLPPVVRAGGGAAPRDPELIWAEALAHIEELERRGCDESIA